ncbi:hypothetical protein CC2G_011723 [Coprinopsis cinerea AmutBmut pab1-1]|nr:hypothetical protein CC2G_011723 [Coprinopsis cinerea AmutBmut pab1-1]
MPAKVILDEFEIEHNLHEGIDLDDVSVTIAGLEEEQTVIFMRDSRSALSWSGYIPLTPKVDHLVFTARSRHGDEIGKLTLGRHDIRQFWAMSDSYTEDERDFVTCKKGLTLKLTFAINHLSQIEDSAIYTPVEIEQMMKDAAQTPALFLKHLAQLAEAGHTYLHLYGTYFTHRFEDFGDFDNVTRAIEAYQLAMEGTDHSELAYATYAQAAGTAYTTRFTLFGDTADLDTALSLLNIAVSRTEVEDIALPERLSRLGIAYRHRFAVTGDLVDLENAIVNQQRAVRLTSSSHPDFGNRSVALGISFDTRFHRKGDLADINRAILNTRRAINSTSEHYERVPLWLSNLGIFYQGRFLRTGMISDVDEGINTLHRAIHLSRKSNPKLHQWWNSLGNAYRLRFSKSGEATDIEKALEFQTKALENTGDEERVKASHLRSLGETYWRRFEVTKNLADIDAAIGYIQQAVDLTPLQHAGRPPRLQLLAVALESRFKHAKDKCDITKAISLFREAATYPIGRPGTRLRAAKEWGLLCRHHDPPQSLEAFKVLVELLSQVAGLEDTVQKRHETLVNIADLTMTAAATAMDQGQFGTAVEWLEQGRCLVWNQINQLRTPVDDLRAHDPDLAERFSKVARALEESGSRQEEEASPNEVDATDERVHFVAAQDEVHSHVKLAKEFQTILAEIRARPGFSDFLQPPRIADQLSKVPEDSAIVTFVMHEDRCDALILRKGLSVPLHIPLEKLTLKRAVAMKDDVRAILMRGGLRLREVNPQPDGEEDDETRGFAPRRARKGDALKKILEELWLKVVNGVVRGIYGEKLPENPGERLRVWWCPTGPLLFLPLHAAGIYKQGGSSAQDLAVSSYTPTISTLLTSLRKSHSSTIAFPAPQNLLLISQPATPHLPPIPGTTEETRSIQTLFSGIAPTTLLEGSEATVSRVADELKSHSWVHFACHAVQDIDSLRSGLHLHDRRLELIDIMKQRDTQTEWDLAFLSACQTGTGDEKLSDEVVHIAAGMLVIGYRSVVATMWSIKDAYGKDVAVGFYEHLLNQGVKGGQGQSGPAWALDGAVRELRRIVGDKEEGLLAWVPYVHYGM